PYTSYATLVFLFGVLVLRAFDAPIGSWTIATLVVISPALIGGWFLVRTKGLSVAEERMGYTGQ
ncbi:L-asparagine permease, partial [Rhodococcus sp. IEGM 1354]|nr:L-asparagine permease [Rhodococcus sp. IEGM 1354]